MWHLIDNVQSKSSLLFLSSIVIAVVWVFWRNRELPPPSMYPPLDEALMNLPEEHFQMFKPVGFPERAAPGVDDREDPEAANTRNPSVGPLNN